MDFLLKTAYYGVTGVSSLVVAFFFLANLFGPSPATETWRHKAVLLTSGSVAIGLLMWSYRMGHWEGNWIGGLATAILAVIVFAVLTFAGIMLFTTLHWQ